MINFLEDLADVLEKHEGRFTTSIDDDGIYVYMGNDRDNKCNLGFPGNAVVGRIGEIVQNIKNRNTIKP